jgi:hypothetical protein
LIASYVGTNPTHDTLYPRHILSED